jgi:hypothetical protein
VQQAAVNITLSTSLGPWRYNLSTLIEERVGVRLPYAS